MASIYSQLAQDLWSNSKPKSNVESLMQTYEEPKDRNGARSRSPTCGRAISRMAHEEELHEREMLNIRNFGYHWLKPIGVTKTMGQIADEAREIHDSYEEYEDEEGEFNQNDPNLTGLEMEGETAQADDELEGEEADLDQDVEEGASFDVGDTSFVSSVPDGSSDADTSAHYATLDGQPYFQGPDSSLAHAQSPQSLAYGTTEVSDQGLSSAEEGSIGEYSSDESYSDAD